MSELETPVDAGSWTGLSGGVPQSLPEQVAAHISQEILRGRVPPGSRLHEQVLADRFQVSRGPIREALRLLERDGLAQITARRGARVSALSVTELDQLLGPRIALNGLAARSAAERADPAALGRLRILTESLEQTAQTDTPESFVLTGYETLKVLCQATGNPHLTRLIFYMSHQTLRYARLGLESGHAREQYARSWRRILAAVRAGDPDVAQAAGERLVREPLERAKTRLALQTRTESAGNPARVKKSTASSAPKAPGAR